jgi:uncharacterized protein YeaO (DUF488 family)
MIKVKHFLEAVGQDDGQRIWVEPVGITKDLREWCKVDLVLPHFGPPRALWDWFEEHPEGYEYFRTKYHEELARSRYKPALESMAKAGSRATFTLLHGSDNADLNTAGALQEFINELEAWSKPEA